MYHRFQLLVMIPDTKYHILNTSSGFTLIELLVTISIFIIVTSITLANFPQFSNKLSLDLLAEDIALSIKQAQVFGSSVFGTVVSGSPTLPAKTFKAYGTHLEKPQTLVPGSRVPDYAYLLYADLSTPPNNRYDGISSFDGGLNCGSVGSECRDKYIVSGINKVLAVCPNYHDLNRTYGLDPKGERISDCRRNAAKILDITFVRPSLEAKFYIKKEDDSILTDSSNVGIVLGVPSASGAVPIGTYQKAVIIWKTGLISTE